MKEYVPTTHDIRRKMANLGVSTSHPRDRGHLAKALVPQDKLAAARTFCQHHFKDNWIWNICLGEDNSEIFFLYEKDLTMFLLTF